tara:strand:+ start:220 stop:597 length:378 start_codon:yes stop_codon:yes gene_type:complete
MLAKRSVGITLDDLIKDIDFEKKVLEKLKGCCKFSSNAFRVVLFHHNVPSKEIKAFIKRNTESLFNIHVDITKQYNTRVFFLIRSYYKSINNYRYMYIGNILDGLNQYITLMHHIKQKENGRRIY